MLESMAQERLEEIREGRLKKRQRLLDAGLPPYPAEVRRTHTLKEIASNFADLEKQGGPEVLVGRIVSLRRHGGLVFADLQDDTAKLQLQLAKDELGDEKFAQLELLDAGDWVEAAGKLISTQRDVQTLLVSEWHMISKSIRPMPSEWFGLKDHEARYREREVDLWLNEKERARFVLRARVNNFLRAYFTKRDFLEVETPMLQPLAGGALAKPFVTHHNTLDIELYLRIAPELYLKRLLVGGFEKVFEIGRNFRNEGIDRQHNPEFTMLEFYWAYADYEDLMDLTEDLFATLASEFKINLAKEIKRARYVELVSEKLGLDILVEKDPKKYLSLFAQHKLAVPTEHSYTKLVDELYKELVRPTLIEPTLLYDYPVEMVPLAKQNLTDPRIAEKFQFLMNGVEFVNAYTELNDPVIQRQRFVEQQLAREAGDSEAHQIDEDYIRALEYGMPPAAGWGMGIDRLVMWLTECDNIRDTILFPLLKPQI